MSPQWMVLKSPVLIDGKMVSALCVEGPEGLRQITGQVEVLSTRSLPYPADPRLRTGEDKCPSFCFAPQTCQGRTSCPRNYACSE